MNNSTTPPKIRLATKADLEAAALKNLKAELFNLLGDQAHDLIAGKPCDIDTEALNLSAEQIKRLLGVLMPALAKQLQTSFFNSRAA